MGAIRQYPKRLEVLNLVEDVINTFEVLHGLLAQLDAELSDCNPPSTGLEGHGDHIHLMHALLPLRSHACRWQLAALQVGAPVNQEDFQGHRSLYNMDSEAVERLLEAL